MSRVRTNPQQPTDDTWPEFQRLIQLKRLGKHVEADEGYKQLAEKERDEPMNYPHVLKSWAKVKVCLGEYDEAILMMEKASIHYHKIGNNVDEWQTKNQAQILRRRNYNRSEFIEYVRSASGGSISYPLNYNYNGLVFSDSPIRWILDSYEK